MSSEKNLADTKRSRVRHLIVFMLFVLTAINYADRATLSIAGPQAAKELGLDAVAMGYVFSAFGWSYVIGQLPGGWLLDRFGSKPVYIASLLLWSFFTMLQGSVGIIAAGYAITTLFVLRFMVGLSESPSFPANSRIVSAWFPTKERGTASAIFNSAQYFATVIFAPLMGWITHEFGWRYVFYVMGVLGILVALVWAKILHSPKDHPSINAAELAYIEEGGGLVSMDQKQAAKADNGPQWGFIKQLLKSRMLMGVYIGQYCITTLTYFFITWFPVYLVQGRGMTILKAGFVASLPALCGFTGGVLGGVISDLLLRKSGSLSLARKVPIVVGMLMSMSMIACNYINVDWIVVSVMALAFFGKGVGALGWAVVSDTSPKEIGGLSAGLFNTFGNTAGITTPIVIGYLVQGTGNFDAALVFVAANALGAIGCYLLVVGEIKRFVLQRNTPSLGGLQK
ncbi:MFS transporter [Telmatospirillum siberiense]|uniref:MFS transporter n=1 Tax=Telmatospirillum siberiense TaxID=382514 RepID=A0A2N3PXT0_9PROT|nr:MFS transporter [Telmatospirillum siberiense]PKU25208.1 MFS transporter [Telmatospirillum siberiense]